MPGSARSPAPKIPTCDPGPWTLITRTGDPVCGLGERDSPLQERGPLRVLRRTLKTSGCSSGGGVCGKGTPAPPLAGSSGQGAARAATDPGSTSSLAPRCPDGGKRDARAGRRRAGHAATRRRAPPRGGRGEAALPLPSPALAPSPSPPPPPPTPPLPPFPSSQPSPPPRPRGGRVQAASNPSCRSSLLFFPLPVWHGHH